MNDDAVECAAEERSFGGGRELAADRAVDRSNGECDCEVKEQA